MTIIIPYIGNQPGFVQLLVSLQPQLHPDDDIYILDMSKDKSALKLTKLYGSTRCYLFIEPTDLPLEEAMRFGYQNMIENKQSGALVISDRCIIPATLISSLKKAIKRFPQYRSLWIKASIVDRGIDKIDPNYTWFGTGNEVVEDEGVGEWDKFSQLFYTPNTPGKEHTRGVLVSETVCVLPDFLEGL